MMPLLLCRPSDLRCLLPAIPTADWVRPCSRCNAGRKYRDVLQLDPKQVCRDRKTGCRTHIVPVALPPPSLLRG